MEEGEQVSVNMRSEVPVEFPVHSHEDRTAGGAHIQAWGQRDEAAAMPLIGLVW